MRTPFAIAIGLVLAGAPAGRVAVAADTVPATAPVATASAAPTATGSAAAKAPLATVSTETAPAQTPPAAATPPAPAARPAPVVRPTVAKSQPQAGVLREPAPRPVTDVRVQSRFAVKAKTTQLFGAAEYLSRGDFYNSPGARVGGAYYPIEALGVELQIAHYWSSLNAEGERIKRVFGLLPDSHAPAWMFLLGGRYSIGYGKLMLGGLGGAIHFEPQAFIHAGMHAHDGEVGPSADAGLGLLVFLTPKLFARIDAAIVYEREDRSAGPVNVWGTVPSLGVGGTL